MISAQYIIGFIIGASFGSFLGVVIDRQTTNDKRQTTNIGGRSRCSSCQRQLKWWENIPIISFIFLAGRCRTCHSPIPYWLPLIELAGGIGGIVISAMRPMSLMSLMGLMAIAAALIWIFFSDLVYGVIPDLAIAVGVVGVITMSLMSRISLMGLMAQAGAAMAAAAFFYFLVLITRRRGMGTGDVTLAFFLGLWLGWPKILVGIWLAFLLGAAVGLALIAAKRKKFGQTIPFGPFLIAAAIIAAMVNDNWRILIGL